MLLRREAYLEHAKLGVKPETIAQLRVSPLHLSTLFDDDSVSKAEKEVSEYEARPPPPVHYRRDQGSHRGGKGQSWRSSDKAPPTDSKPTAKKYWKQVAKKSSSASKNSSDKPDFPKSAKK